MVRVIPRYTGRVTENTPPNHFYLKDGESMFLQNAGIHIQDYKVSRPNEHSLNSHHCDNLKLKTFILFTTKVKRK